MNVELRQLVMSRSCAPAAAASPGEGGAAGRRMAGGRPGSHLAGRGRARDRMPHLIVLFAFSLLALVATCALVG